MKTVREIREAAAGDEGVTLAVASGELHCNEAGDFFLNGVAVENADFVQDLIDGTIVRDGVVVA